jgi:hypothetical protein
LCLEWKKNVEHLVVKVILELHVVFFPSVLQILPMLSMLLSVEELESLVIPYCHVFENHLHFLAFVTLVVLQLLLIIIKPWFHRSKQLMITRLMIFVVKVKHGIKIK